MIRLFSFVLFNLVSIYSFGQLKTNLQNLLSTKFQSYYIGGLNNYRPQYDLKIKKYDYKVSNKDEFLRAIKNADKYQVIFIDGNAEIDLSNMTTIFIKTGVKIVSDRGANGSKGARIFTKRSKIIPLFECGSYVHFIGLRIDGTDYNVYNNNVKKGSFQEDTYGAGITQGIRSQYTGLTITNCEFSGWTHAAVLVKGTGAKISYSYFHHNRRYGLGYGICVDGGSAQIIGNLFDFNRHSIASTGIRNSAYVVEHNIFLEHDSSHSVDVHGGKDRKDNTNLAGEQFYVNNNYFRLRGISNGAFVIRGIPSKKADFLDNTIEIIDNSSKNQSAKAKYIKQINASGKFTERNNILK